MIFKNIIEMKIHKVDMKLYRAFEVLFFNSRKDVIGMKKIDDEQVSDNEDSHGYIKSGNESVIEARLSDAEFFWRKNKSQNMVKR